MTLFDHPRLRSIGERFAEFHAANPEIYRLFCRFARQAKDAGHQRYSADAVMHAIRWHVEVETRGDAFKLNNNWCSHYARQMARDYPDMRDFFEFRRLKSA